MNKHTLGPWYSQYDDNGFYKIGSEAVAFRLAFTYGEGDTDEANARLIAAAPDLLAALEYAIKQVPELETVPGIAAAIAKAKGEV